MKDRNSSPKKPKQKKRIYNDRTVDGPELVDVNTDSAVLRKGAAARKMQEECINWAEFFKRNNLQ